MASYVTRTARAHDASRHAVPVHTVHVGRPCRAEMSEISQSSRTTTVESSMESRHNLYLACEDSPQCAFFFCTFSCSLFALLASTVHWLRNFLFLTANHRLRSVLDSAKHICCGGPAALPYPSSMVKKLRSSLSSLAGLGILASASSILVSQCTWCSSTCTWAQIDIPERDRHVRTYIVRIDPSFKASR